ncbi:hypothetical protein GOP47_0001028 [Adiantum capillus-veneris]|uniref:Uncharacterized protein n=1 Tax=Adiantum capillus-veneris TaxID=13818 RepID=A0A9D4VF02_ADICA|nr:hypothetical protein GOP47_0001028 [Adiantum capillus-veneris]
MLCCKCPLLAGGWLSCIARDRRVRGQRKPQHNQGRRAAERKRCQSCSVLTLKSDVNSKVSTLAASPYAMIRKISTFDLSLEWPLAMPLNTSSSPKILNRMGNIILCPSAKEFWNS